MLQSKVQSMGLWCSFLPLNSNCKKSNSDETRGESGRADEKVIIAIYLEAEDFESMKKVTSYHQISWLSISSSCFSRVTKDGEKLPKIITYHHEGGKGGTEPIHRECGQTLQRIVPPTDLLDKVCQMSGSVNNANGQPSYDSTMNRAYVITG